MGTVLVAASAGLESTYLMQHILETTNHDVYPVYLDVTQRDDIIDGEYHQLHHIVDRLNELFPKRIGRPGLCMGNSWLMNSSNHLIEKESLCHNTMQQQAMTIYSLANMRSALVSYAPTCMVGWIKEDAFETSLFSGDMTNDEYRRLLELGPELLDLTNNDKSRRPFLAPLWDMTKKEIHEKLDPVLKGLVLLNPTTVTHYKTHMEVTSRVSKLKEYVDAGIPNPPTSSVVNYFNITLAEQSLISYRNMDHQVGIANSEWFIEKLKQELIEDFDIDVSNDKLAKVFAITRPFHHTRFGDDPNFDTIYRFALKSSARLLLNEKKPVKPVSDNPCLDRIKELQDAASDVVTQQVTVGKISNTKLRR